MGCGASSAAPKDTLTYTTSPMPTETWHSRLDKGDANYRDFPPVLGSPRMASEAAHFYCGVPHAPRNAPYLGSDPHQMGWLAGMWASSSDDHERTDALRKLGILLTEREDAFDRMTELGALLYGTPMCLISFVDEEEQWFKSAVGLNDSSTGRDMAFCTYTVLRDMPGVFVVLDAPSDPRFAKNPLVTGPPYIQFYAGAPIFHPDSSHKIGSFCVIDTKPWPLFSDKDRRILQALADMVQHELVSRATKISHENKTRVLMTLSSEMREMQRGLEGSISSYQNLVEAAHAPIFAVDASQRLLVTQWNRCMCAFTGIPADAAIGRSVVDVFQSLASNEGQRRTLIRALLRVLDSPIGDKRPSRQKEAVASTNDARSIDLELGTRVEGQEQTLQLRLMLAPIVSAAHHITGVVCIGRDRSETDSPGASSSALARSARETDSTVALTEELRAPLNGVCGVLELALRDTELQKTQAARALQQAWTSAKILAAILDDSCNSSQSARMLAQNAAAMRNGVLSKPPSCEELFTAHEACDVALAVTAFEAQQHGIRLLTTMNPAMRGIFLRGDPHRLARVTIALLDLAVRAAGPRDDIELRMDLTPSEVSGTKDLLIRVEL
mmetsp:Transcript_19439/g.49406  ORF Transcript_19439/g.49406 Transcript_19439/m.49406 type:complete len:612 (+) Transcript_19439:64-1899(+)